MTAPRHVVLFGLSANPPTGLGGHAGMVRWAATRRDLPELDGHAVDEVWVLPVYVHAFADKRDMPDFEHRLRMSEIAFRDELPEVRDKVRVLDVERELVEREGGPNGEDGVRVGTVDVVRHLTARDPGARFALLLGADTYQDLRAGRWKEAEALMAMVSVVALPRPGVDVTPDRPDGPPLEPVSSTEIRASTDLAFLSQVLQPGVLAYIRAHRLYGFAGEPREGM